jgi:hypothetical protein
MKTFIIINGEDITLLECVDIQQARDAAINFCDHSKDIIVREFENVTNTTNMLITIAP